MSLHSQSETGEGGGPGAATQSGTGQMSPSGDTFSRLTQVPMSEAGGEGCPVSAWASWGLWEPTRLDNLTAPSKLLVLEPESPPGGSLVRPHGRGWPFLGPQPADGWRSVRGSCPHLENPPHLAPQKGKKRKAQRLGPPGTGPGSILRGRDKKLGGGLQLRSEMVFSGRGETKPP